MSFEEKRLIIEMVIKLFQSVCSFSLLISLTIASPIGAPLNPSVQLGCRLQIECTDGSATGTITWSIGMETLTSGGNIQINTFDYQGGLRSQLTFIAVTVVGQTTYQCSTSNGVFSNTVTVQEPVALTEIPDLGLGSYVEGQGYFVPCIVSACSWPVQLEWEKDNIKLFTQTLSAEETGSLSTRTGLFDTVLERSSIGSYSCKASVLSRTVAQGFMMTGVVRTQDL